MTDRYQLYHGDCLDILPTLEAESIDAVITDPPYGLGDLWTGGTWFQRGVYQGNVSWDSVAPQETINAILSMGVTTILWGGNYFELPASRCWLLWEKNYFPTMADFEMAWTNLNAPAQKFNFRRSGWSRSHPTEKPVALMEWCIELATQPGDIIFDPFMGSGTTGVAAMRTGRRFIGIELDAEYYAIAEQRIKNAAGEFVLTEKEKQTGQMALFGGAL